MSKNKSKFKMVMYNKKTKVNVEGKQDKNGRYYLIINGAMTYLSYSILDMYSQCEEAPFKKATKQYLADQGLSYKPLPE